MDLVLAFGTLFAVGNKIHKTKVPLKSDADSSADLKLARKPPPMNGREQFLYDAANSASFLPGRSRATAPFRRQPGRAIRMEVENNYEPLIGNVNQTKKRQVYDKSRYQIKRRDYKDADGNVPESYSTGQQDAGHIWRSEYTREVLSENRKKIADRFLNPKNSKKYDAHFPGRYGSLGVRSSEKISNPMLIGGEPTSFKPELLRSRIVLSTVEQKRGHLPDLTDKAFTDRSYVAHRLNPSGLYTEQMAYDGDVIQKPTRRLDEELQRQPVLNNASQRQMDLLRGLSTTGTKRHVHSEASRPLQDNYDRNGRVWNPDVTSRNRVQKMVVQTRPVLEGIEKERLTKKDFISSSRQGIKVLAENRKSMDEELAAREVPGSWESYGVATLPVRGITTGANERHSHRE